MYSFRQINTQCSFSWSYYLMVCTYANLPMQSVSPVTVQDIFLLLSYFHIMYIIRLAKPCKTYIIVIVFTHILRLWITSLSINSISITYTMRHNYVSQYSRFVCIYSQIYLHPPENVPSFISNRSMNLMSTLK